VINRTVTAVLDAPRQDVFEYLAAIENLPDWATEFARELRFDGEDAVVRNGLGEFYVRFAVDSETGVIDMYAGPTKDELALFPTRVVELSEERSAYSFTMFKAPGMPDELFESQYESLRREFANIRARFAIEGPSCRP
jgi:hypothetical protein